MHIKKLTAISLSISLATFNTYAEVGSYQFNSFISESGIELTPTLMVGVSNDNNLYYQPDNEKSTSILNISPKLLAVIQDGVNLYGLELSTNNGNYRYDSSDNYGHFNIELATHNEFTDKHRLDVEARISAHTEDRGTGLSEGTAQLTAEPVELLTKNISANYEFGGLASAARVAIASRYLDKRYQNFREISKYRDHEKLRFMGTAFYNTQSGSDIFLEVSQDDIQYGTKAADTDLLDSMDYRVLVGVNWEASALTSGKVKVGYQKKNFDAQSRNNFSGLSWEAGVTWQPLTYSQFGFVTSQAAEDPLVEGDYVKTTRLGLNWSHEWQERVRTHIKYQHIKSHFVGIERNDYINNVRLSLDYKSSFGVVSSYMSFTDKNSDLTAYKYEKRVLGIEVTLGLRDK
ncbi:outer membrane beta-barrel protein [Pseudoalteromonas sp. MMG010]|uniref:outer membrane beta-barrel protein n=1 Tax=Pseudoalteromonas sp. MMG010 TaxID=2822685 RepID=UPI001B3A30DE|nr:outer membrane beta-barrel protein [Pseudoalteromonas sp. MMG010]MBQ4834134.1 outer membrane beta-barrel protein [Pseudoalteromonas sp. MMG010]